MITGKTITQLDLLSNITDDTSMPVELSGNTYHVQYSAITNNLINQGFNNGVKLLCKQQINLSEPTIPTGNGNFNFCLEFPCPSPTNPFVGGETVTNEIGSTAIVNYDFSYGISVSNIIGTFSSGDTITGSTSLATNSIILVETTDYSYQEVILTGGTKFFIDNTFITNSTDFVTSSVYGQLTSGTTNLETSGYSIFVYPITNRLLTPEYVLLGQRTEPPLPPPPGPFPFDPPILSGVVSYSPMYYQQQGQASGTTTADLYIYGYILE